MFERFTRGAREVVIGAQDEARRLHHPLITTPHLLLSLLSGEAADLLEAHGVTAEAARGEFAELLRQDPRIADDDTAVLAAIGIDMAAIRAAVEATFGPGALDRPSTLPEQEQPGLLRRLLPRRTRSTARPADEMAALRQGRGNGFGHVPFSPASKKAMELSLREAIRLGSGEIRPEHLTLGLMRTGDGAAAVLLHRLGVDAAAVRRDAEQRLRRSA